jgi:tetratricopeptide (TPR) repeat protein
MGIQQLWVVTAEILVKPGDLASDETKGFTNIVTWADSPKTAQQKASEVLRSYPNFAHAHRVLERIYDEKHMFPEAIVEGERAVALASDDTWMLLDLANTYALAGKKTEMKNCLRKAANLSPGGVLPEVGATAEIYVALGDVDRALKVIESAYRRREGGLILLKADPRFDSLKSDPRFQQLLLRIGLPQ